MVASREQCRRDKAFGVVSNRYSPRSAGWSWRLELECCERKILLGWLELELELVAGVV